MAKKLPSSINLLDPVYAPDDAWDKLYYWVFNVGKYLFVFVEIAVLSVFLSRFVVDRKNNDLSREINDAVETLSSDFFRTIDVRYSNLHNLLLDLRTNSENQEINSKVIASVLDSLPSNIELQRFSFSGGEVHMDFLAGDFQSIHEFENVINNNPAYGDARVRLQKSGDVSNDIEFSVSFPINSDKLIVEESETVERSDPLEDIVNEAEGG